MVGGQVEEQVLPRSCNKPIQALAMVRAGLDLPPELLALACASHSGEAFHIEGVRRILAGAGLSEESPCRRRPTIRSTTAAREQVIREGGAKTSIQMNCSGKHAAMLATCVLNGWSTDDYLDPGHPLQVAIADTFAELTGEPVKVVAVDGCGAPLLSTSLIGLARAFRALAIATSGPSARGRGCDPQPPGLRLGHDPRRARTAHRDPGLDRQGRRGVLLRGGAGRRQGVRAEDRRRGPAGAPVLMAAALERSGVLDLEGVDAVAVRKTGELPLLGGGKPVGEIRASF